MMVLVTVGTQLPFDRLVAAVDNWAQTAQNIDLFSQIGPGPAFQPSAGRFAEMLSPEEFRGLFERADCIVSHAGIGTILAALELAKPIIVMPRLARLGEQRTDHQVATADRFSRLGVVQVANTDQEMVAHLDRLEDLNPTARTGYGQQRELCDYVGQRIRTLLGNTEDDGIDSVVCFGGEDWWYHNRGHFDMQMMRQARRRLPVLYVNSIGVRSPHPGEGGMFITRLRRKLRSFLRGMRTVEPRFTVYSPVTSPKIRRVALGRWFTARQVKRVMRRLRMRNPLLWVAVPTAADLVRDLPWNKLVYQRTDRFEEFAPAVRDEISRMDLKLKSKADLTLFASHYLLERESAHCRRALFVDHGVDIEMFQRAAQTRDEPADCRGIPRPRVGFVGGVDDHTFDASLFLDVVRRLPSCSFIMVGAVSLPADWCHERNVWFLGRKPYLQVANYMASCDVLIMPWRNNEWIRACNPVKLKEYLAVGKPVVSTYFPELDHYDGDVTVADGPEQFAGCLANILSRGESDSPRTFEDQTWRAKFDTVYRALSRGTQ